MILHSRWKIHMPRCHTHTHTSKYLISVITGGIIPAVIAIVFTHCSHYSPLTLDDSVDSMHAPRVINSNRWDTNTNADRIRNSLLQPTSKETIAPDHTTQHPPVRSPAPTQSCTSPSPKPQLHPHKLTARVQSLFELTAANRLRWPYISRA